jgi:hypothetical protein
VLGGWDRVRRKTEVLAGGEVIGRETVLLTGAETMFRVTAFPREVGKMEDHLRRFLRHTRLEAIQWVNINRQRLTFHTIRR